MNTMSVTTDALTAARQAVSELNTRMQELTIDEMRGRKVSKRLRRALMQKRDEAHRIIRATLGRSRD
jgi:hypothetical protein